MDGHSKQLFEIQWNKKSKLNEMPLLFALPAFEFLWNRDDVKLNHSSSFKPGRQIIQLVT